MTAEQENRVIRHFLAMQQQCKRDADHFRAAAERARRYAYDYGPYGDGESENAELVEAIRGLDRLRKAAENAAAAIRTQMESLPGYAESEFGGAALDSMLEWIEFPAE